MAKSWAKIIGAGLGLVILCALIYFIIWWTGPTNPRVVANLTSTLQQSPNIGLSPKFEPSPGMPVLKGTLITIGFPWWGWLIIGLAALAYIGVAYWLWKGKTSKANTGKNSGTPSPSM